MSALALVATSVLLTVPGWAVGTAAGLRLPLAAGVGAVLTYGLVAVAVTVFPTFGITWDLLSFSVLTVVVAALVGGARLLLRRRSRPLTTAVDDTEDRPAWGGQASAWVAAAVAVASLVGAWVVYRATGGFTYFQQGYDATFHANGILVTADARTASSGVLSQVAGTDTTGAFFYPNAYHALSALLVENGLPIQTAMDTQAAASVGLLAGGLVALVASLRGTALLAGAVALVASAAVALPYDLYVWGPLLPFNTAATLVPAALAVVVLALRSARTGLGWVLVALTMAGLLTLHPSVALVVALGTGALLLQRWVTGGLRVLGHDALRLGLAAVLTVVLALGQFLGSLRAAASATSGEGLTIDWPADRTPGQALGELLTYNVHLAQPQVWLSALLVVGLATSRRLRAWWWFLATGGVFMLLYVVTAAYEGPWVSLLTDFWWNDRYRFAALAAPSMMLLTAAGVVAVVDVLAKAAPRRVAGPGVVRAAATGLVAVLLVVLTQGLYIRTTTAHVARAFGPGPSGGTQERDALDYLAGMVGPDSLVMNDPFDGSAWMWAGFGIRPVFGQALFFPNDRESIGPDRRALYDSLNELDDDPSVQAAVRALGVDYVFVGTRMLNESVPRAPGLVDLEDVRSLQLVFGSPDGAQVYRVVADTGV